MKQASRIIASWSGASDVITPERLACNSWKKAVGNRLAQRTHAAKLVRNTLVVEVEDQIWQRQLWSLRRQILKNVEQSIGPGIVTDLDFRVMPPRRGPERETQSVPGLFAAHDDADQIADPGLRRIYKAARSRETA